MKPYRSWTNEDVEKLEKLVAANASAARASAALNRPIERVKHKARQLGYKFPISPRFSFKKLGL